MDVLFKRQYSQILWIFLSKLFFKLVYLFSGVYAGMVCFSYDGIVGQFIDVQCISDTQLQGGEHQGANRSPLCG